MLVYSVIVVYVSGGVVGPARVGIDRKRSLCCARVCVPVEYCGK